MRIVFIGSIAVLLALASCSPKNTTISGQVFIATRGGASLKLGAVEIAVIEKQQVTNFIHGKSSDLPSARDAAQAAQTDYDSFLAGKPFQTNAEYLRLSTERNLILKQVADVRPKYDSLRWQIVAAETHPQSLPADSPFKPYTAPTQNGMVKSALPRTGQDVLNATTPQLRAVLAQSSKKLDEFRSQIDLGEKRASILADQMAAIESRGLKEKREKLDSAKAHLARLTKADSFFADFAPVVIAKANTDADGNFSLSYPAKKDFSLYARSERSTLSDSEKYFWLIDAPVNGEGSRVFLNNNNLIQNDPDHYLKTKLE